MWSLFSTNTLCSQFEKQRENKRLRKTISSIKSTVNLQPPRFFPAVKPPPNRQKPRNRYSSPNS